jgi:outer membrane protein assembly factor BamB
MMRFDRYLLSTSQRLNSVRFPAKGAVQLLTTLFVVFLSLCLFPNLAVAASPHIYDVPQGGYSGSQTTTVGNGWDPNATLDIYFDSTDVGLVDTDNNGTFGLALKAQTIRQNGLTIQIPNDAVPGQHWITAVERITQLQAQVAFTVWGIDWPQFHYGPDRTGFNPYENVLSPDTVGNLTIRWKYQIPGYVSTGATVANGAVYSSAKYGDLSALDAATGALLWIFPFQV